MNKNRLKNKIWKPHELWIKYQSIGTIRIILLFSVSAEFVCPMQKIVLFQLLNVDSIYFLFLKNFVHTFFTLSYIKRSTNTFRWAETFILLFANAHSAPQKSIENKISADLSENRRIRGVKLNSKSACRFK